jgi:hypothetical protein
VFAAAAAACEHYTVVEIAKSEGVITYWKDYSLASKGFEVMVSLDGCQRTRECCAHPPSETPATLCVGSRGSYCRQVSPPVGAGTPTKAEKGNALNRIERRYCQQRRMHAALRMGQPMPWRESRAPLLIACRVTDLHCPGKQ